MNRRSTAAGAAVLLVGLIAGVLLGRASAPSCTQARDEHAAVARQIAAQAQADVDRIDGDLVSEARARVESRSECFSTEEREEIRRLDELHGTAWEPQRATALRSG